MERFKTRMAHPSSVFVRMRMYFGAAIIAAGPLLGLIDATGGA